MDEYIKREALLRPFIIDKKGNRIRETDIDNWQVEIPIKQVKQIIREIPAADVVEVEAVKEWLYQIALNNVGVHFEDVADVCERIIENLDGLRLFAKERRNDAAD